ncbi:MAG: single-stranded-DNA-specific exonuclease RecJ [Spirochaetia bacterium]|nr:single-stranded-DNA-specific exonuclease RecJ [Spirochaetia bacterium]
MKWNKKKIDVTELKRLHDLFGVDVISASVLARRNITSKNDIKFFLENELIYLHSPFLFEDMGEVVDRINEACEEKEKIRIFGDRDVDGITSTSLLKEELDGMGLDVTWSVPDGDDPYGMTLDKVHKAKEDGISLIITVDCGISEVEEIALSRQLGIDTIVLDHHLAGETLPPAIAIIDPKIEDCGYPFEHLAGCGVVSKVIWALRFSQTDLYNESVILLHAQPGNETVRIQALKFRNFIETDRVVDEISPGLIKASQSKIIPFLDCGLPILVLDAATEKIQLTAAFGSNVDIYLQDLRADVDKSIPQVRGKSLFNLSLVSHSGRYSLIEHDELDVLLGLFQSLCLRRYPRIGKEFDSVLDLVAIGTIADMMPMVDENRILVRRGLQVLSTVPRMSLVPLLTAKGLLGKKIGTTEIGWNISPLINAAGRMGKPDVAVKMLLADKQEEIEELSRQLIALNKQRQKLGDTAWTEMQKEAKRSYEYFGTKMVLVEHTSVNRGITGLMASRLLTLFGAPAMVIARTGEGSITGSMRSPEGFNIRDFLANFDSLLDDYGGHACAGGFSLSEANLPTFKKQVEDVLDTMDCLEEQEDVIDIDCTVPPQYMTPKLLKVSETFEPYGEQNPAVVYQISGARVLDAVFIGNAGSGVRHLRLTLSYGAYKWPGVYWRASQKLDKDFAVGDSVDCVFRLGRNNFRGQETLQLTIMDMHRIMKKEDQTV